MDAINLTPEEAFWGRVYFFIHERAELLRQRETAAESDSVSQAGTDKATAEITTLAEPAQLVNSSTRRVKVQNGGVR